MAEIIKTAEQIEELFRLVVLTILKLDPDAPENQHRVRFHRGFDMRAGIGGDSAPKISEDACVIYALPHDDPVNRHRNRKYEDPDARRAGAFINAHTGETGVYTPASGGGDLVAVDEHTDVHCICFANYGPNAYECARDIRDKLFAEEIRLILRRNHFALVPDVPAIKRVPEQCGGQWLNRVDFQAVFNEYVRRESVMPAIKEIKVTAMAAKPDGAVQTAQAHVKRVEMPL